jgi:hypothetical protein
MFVRVLTPTIHLIPPLAYLRLYVPLKNFSLTIAGEGLQNLGLCSALRDFEQGGIFIVPHLLWHGTSRFIRSHLKDRPIQSPLTTHVGMWRTNSDPDPHGEITQRKTSEILKALYQILLEIWQIQNRQFSNLHISFRLGKIDWLFIVLRPAQ